LIRVAAGALTLAAVAFFCLPIVQVEAPVSSVVLDRDGRLLGAVIAADEQWRFPPLTSVPERFEVALLAAEDKRFHRHIGVDPLAVARAVRLNLGERRVVSGASTLTMQTVRIARGNPSRTLPEKAWEALLALRLERSVSKGEILATYASHAPFGGNTVGLEAAAFRYFGRGPDELSWAEAATLAVLPNNPALVRPGRNAPRLRARRDALLGRLHVDGSITANELRLGVAESLPGAPHPVPRVAPHLVAKRQGHRTLTTIDRRLQEQAVDVILRHSEGLDAQKIHNLAALITDVRTGEVLAYVGNVPRDQPIHGTHVDIVRARRSTGSTLKPFLYEALLDSGELLPDQLVPDVPMRIGGFAPENFDRKYEGALPASEALARSRNVPAAWMLKRYGVERFAARLRDLGLTTLHRDGADYGLSLVLGGAEGSLWDLVGMYRGLGHAVAFPTDEMRVQRWRESTVSAARRPDPASAWATVQALLEVRRPGVHGAWRSFDSGRKVAWKTGTSYGFRDAWAVGVTPEVAIGVWVGNHDGEGRAGLTGFEAAAPVLFDLFDLVDTGGWFDAPPGLVEAEVCTRSGERAGPDCEHTEEALLPHASLAATGCSRCERIHCDEGCRERVHAGCAAPSEMHAEGWFTLPPGQEWFYSRRRADYRPLPPWREGCDADEARMSVLSPREGAEVFVPRELNGERGRVVFEAAHRDRGGEIHWHLDEEFVGTTTAIHQLALAPTTGHHTLTLVDARGGRVQRRFEVLGADLGRR
jgi:penicillin-binding protein 1C